MCKSVRTISFYFMLFTFVWSHSAEEVEKECSPGLGVECCCVLFYLFLKMPLAVLFFQFAYFF